METDGVRDEFILDCTGKEKRVEKNLGGKTPESVNGSGQGHVHSPPSQITSYPFRSPSIPFLDLSTMVVIGKWISFTQPANTVSDTPLPKPIPIPCTADGKQFGLENVRVPPSSSPLAPSHHPSS